RAAAAGLRGGTRSWARHAGRARPRHTWTRCPSAAGARRCGGRVEDERRNRGSGPDPRKVSRYPGGMQTDGHLTRHGARGWLRVLTSLLAAVALAGCSGGVVLEPTEGPVVEPRKIAQAMLPEDPVTAFEPGNPAEIALRASQLFFESAQVVVLASSTEAAAISRASSFAVSLGTPLLLTSPPGQNTSGQDVTEQTDTSA